MSAKTQAKVLRVLQEGEVERLGSARTIKVDVRVIAATNKNLEEEIEKGHFREDLYFRLAVIPVYVPPLRERPDDIPQLVRHFMEYFSRDNNVRAKRITPGALETLQRHRWKGNIRELRNTVERLIIMTNSDAIDVADLPEVVRSPLGEFRGRGRRRSRQAPRRSSRQDPGSNEGGHAAGVQGQRRTRLSRRQAARERLEYLEDRRSHRHAPQQPVQEARTVPDLTGNRRLDVLACRRLAALVFGADRLEWAGSQRDRRPRGLKRKRQTTRKVRTPQGSAPGNSRSGQPEGQWHRKHTAHLVASGFSRTCRR